MHKYVYAYAWISVFVFCVCVYVYIWNENDGRYRKQKIEIKFQNYGTIIEVPKEENKMNGIKILNKDITKENILVLKKSLIHTYILHVLYITI